MLSMADPSVLGQVLKDDMFVPKWLSKVSTFNVTEFLQTCKQMQNSKVYDM